MAAQSALALFGCGSARSMPAQLGAPQLSAAAVQGKPICVTLDGCPAWTMVQHNQGLLEVVLSYVVSPCTTASGGTSTSGGRPRWRWKKRDTIESRGTRPSTEAWLTDSSRQALCNLGRIARVCKRWRAIVERDTLWAALAAAPGRCNSIMRLTKQYPHAQSWRDHYARTAVLMSKKRRTERTIYVQPQAGDSVKVRHRPTRGDFAVVVVVTYRSTELFSTILELDAFRGDLLMTETREHVASAAVAHVQPCGSFSPVIDLLLFRKRDGKSFVLASVSAVASMAECSNGGSREIVHVCRDISASDSPACSVEFPGVLEAKLSIRSKEVAPRYSSTHTPTVGDNNQTAQQIEVVGVEVSRSDTPGPPTLCWGAICAHGTVSRSMDDLLRQVDGDHQYSVRSI